MAAKPQESLDALQLLLNEAVSKPLATTVFFPAHIDHGHRSSSKQAKPFAHPGATPKATSPSLQPSPTPKSQTPSAPFTQPSTTSKATSYENPFVLP